MPDYYYERVVTIEEDSSEWGAPPIHREYFIPHKTAYSSNHDSNWGTICSIG